jgi:hypothetical protein
VFKVWSIGLCYGGTLCFHLQGRKTCILLQHYMVSQSRGCKSGVFTKYLKQGVALTRFLAIRAYPGCGVSSGDTPASRHSLVWTAGRVIPTASSTDIAVLWDTTPCTLLVVNCRFDRVYQLHFQSRCVRI